MADITGGSIIWDLDVAAGKLSSGLVKAGKEVSDFAKDTEKRIASMSQTIVESFKKAENGSKIFAGGLTAISGALGFAVKSAGDMEMLRSSLDTLTGSAEKGSDLFKELNKFAAFTPFETKDLAKSTETMLAFGISTEKVMPNLQMLGDLSLGNTEKLRGLSLAFSQIQSTGRLMGQDLLQMINQGFNPLTIISQQTGKSMADLKKEMEKGAISAEMVADAMKVATGEGGLFFEGMKRGSQTFQGIFSTMTDTIQMTIRQMVGLSETGEIIEGGLFETVKNAITGLTNFLNANQGSIINFFNNTLGWIKENGALVAGIITGGLTPAFVGMASAFVASMVPLIPFLVAGALLGVTIQKIVDSMGGWESVQQKVLDTLSLFEPFSVVFDNIKNKVNSFVDDGLKSSLGGYLTILDGQFQAFKERLFDTFGFDPTQLTLFSFLQQLGTNILPEIEGVFIQIKQGFLNAFGVGEVGNIGDAFGQLIGPLTTLSDIFSRLLTPTIQVLKDSFVRLKPELDYLLQQLGPVLFNTLKIVVGALVVVTVAITGFITSLVQGFASALPSIAAFIGGILQFVSGFMQILVGIFSLNWRMIWEGIKDVAKGIFVTVTAGFAAILHFIDGFIGGVIAFFQNLYDVLVGNSIVPDLVNEIVNWFARLPQMITSALSGLVSAISQPFDRAWDAIKGTIDKIKGGIDRISPFHRESPSLVDNVRNGVRAIIDEYDKLNTQISISRPGFETPQVSSGNSGNYNVYIDKVNDQQDARMIARELGFRAGFEVGMGTI